ncbi:hypothetical protein HZS_5958, partial [Henneguya salminicola]
ESHQLDPSTFSANNYLVGNNTECIRDVWAHNLFEEFLSMLEISKKYKFIAMDTEYPGTVVKVPVGPTTNIFQYTTIASNVNLLKLIQLGLSFFNENGERPEGANTWQFNFKFCPALDMNATDSMQMLISAGFDFSRHDQEGIEHMLFAELLYTSNLLMNPKIRWITFHGSADFCYLVKMLINTNLPHQEKKFYPLLNTFFPRLYDLKYIMRDCRDLNGGLQYISDSLKVTREGYAHHAGSDSLTTGKLFFIFLERYFENTIFEDKYCGRLFGYNNMDSIENLKNFYGESKLSTSY